MKHYRVEIMPTAKAGLLEIGEYIALDNPTRAISFIDEITDLLLKKSPVWKQGAFSFYGFFIRLVGSPARAKGLSQ